MKGAGAFKGDNGTVFYGVGISDNGPNLSLRREKADSRARADVAVQMKVGVQKLTMDYMSDHKDYFDKDNTSGSDEMTTVVSKSVVDQALVGSHIVDRWEDPKDGSLYSLAKLEVGDSLYDSYEQALKKTLRAQHKMETQAQMNDALDKLDTEVGRQRRRESDIMGATEQAPKISGSANQ